ADQGLGRAHGAREEARVELPASPRARLARLHHRAERRPGGNRADESEIPAQAGADVRPSASPRRLVVVRPHRTKARYVTPSARLRAAWSGSAAPAGVILAVVVEEAADLLAPRRGRDVAGTTVARPVHALAHPAVVALAGDTARPRIAASARSAVEAGLELAIVVDDDLPATSREPPHQPRHRHRPHSSPPMQFARPRQLSDTPCSRCSRRPDRSNRNAESVRFSIRGGRSLPGARS